MPGNLSTFSRDWNSCERTTENCVKGFGGRVCTGGEEDLERAQKY